MFAINTGKVVNLSMSRYDVENKYKSIINTSHKIETQINQAKSVKQLFSNTLLNLRLRLCDDIKAIFRFAPLEHGQFCEELLWKRNYYDYVKFFKKFRKQLSPIDLKVFRMHFLTGIGHYQSLFLSFYQTFNLVYLEDFLSFTTNNKCFNYENSNANYNLASGDSKICNNSKGFENDFDTNFFIGNLKQDSGSELDLEYLHDEKFHDAISFLVHRFCICIGDLARYMVEFFPTGNRFTHRFFKIASYYYRAASAIKPSLGMPFNQLGTLYTGSFYGLDSLYFYARCLNSTKSFLGVKDNMHQTFETARKTLASLSNMFKTSKFIPNNPPNRSVKEALLQIIIFFSDFFNLTSSFKSDNFSLSVNKIFAVSNITLEKISLALNATLDVEPNKESLRAAPNTFSTESIFQIISILIILIEQIKTVLKNNSIDIKLEDVKSIKNESMLTDPHLKGNFILFITYRFLFQFITQIVMRESQLLKKQFDKIQFNFNEKSTDNLNKKGKNKQTKSYKPILGTSFTSEYNDSDDIAMLNQLKSTALQSIVSLFDQSDNEEDEINGFGDNQDSDNESIADILDKLILSDQEDDLRNGSLIDEAIGRNAIPSSHLDETKKNSKDFTSDLLKETMTMDQLLTFIYSHSFTPVIKFFCDFLHSSGDFVDLFGILDVLSKFFEAFFEYLNRLSEFDYKLVTTLRQYINRCLKQKTESDMKKCQSLLELNSLILKYSTEPVTEYKQKHPLSSERDYLHITEEISNHFDQQYNISSANNYQLYTDYSCEQQGYVCMRSILVFGFKLVLLFNSNSLNSQDFKMSLENIGTNLVIQNLSQKTCAKFVITKIPHK